MKVYKALGILVVLMLLIVPAQSAAGKPSVAVGDVKITPAVLMPGDAGSITVTITNPAKNLGAGDTTSDRNDYTYGTGTSNGVDISHTQSTTRSSTDTPDGAVVLKEVTLVTNAPIHVTSKSINDIGRLGMGDKVDVTFTIKADDNAPDGMYPITLKVRTDDDAIYLNYPLTVQISSAPLKIVINDAPRAFSTAKKSVILDIVNLRPNGVTGVSVVPEGDEFTFKPMQEYIVGNIGTGEMYTVQFDVTAKNATYGGNPSFKVVYKNGDNWHETAPTPIYSDHAAAMSASAAGNDNSLLYVGGIIAVLAAALGGFFLYMRGKRTAR